jgi:predicted ArsR family transcriptional regulator
LFEATINMEDGETRRECLVTHTLPLPDHAPSLDKDAFLRSVLRELAGVLEQTVGEREAEAYVNYVGLVLGQSINEIYRNAYATERLDIRQVAATLIDLKAKIDGGFTIESMDAERIVLVNTRCPFGDKVIGRPSLCRMTANIFGAVTAENLGYARVRIDEAIARGDAGCRVVVDLVKADGTASAQETEFFGAGS